MGTRKSAFDFFFLQNTVGIENATLSRIALRYYRDFVTVILTDLSGGGGGLATAFDLAAFRLSMMAPVKKSVNHSRTVASMREKGWEQQQF